MATGASCNWVRPPLNAQQMQYAYNCNGNQGTFMPQTTYDETQGQSQHIIPGLLPPNLDEIINNNNAPPNVNNMMTDSHTVTGVTYADAAIANTYTNEADIEVLSTIKPVFIEEYDIFGSTVVNKFQYMKHPEMFRAISGVASAKTIKDLQRVRGLWRIYLDCEYSRENLISRGVTIRKKLIQLYAQNPRVLARETPDGVRLRIKDIPLSADDEQIIRKLEMMGCTIRSCYRERLRMDGLLTDCRTGDILITIDPITPPLPRNMTIGKYKAVVIHKGQIPPGGLKCNKCLGDDHRSYECKNDWRCRFCNEIGHKQDDCEAKQEMENEPFSDQEENTQTEPQSEQQVKSPTRLKLTGQRKSDKSKTNNGDKKKATLTSSINLTLTPNKPAEGSKTMTISRSPVTPPDVLRAQDDAGTEKKVRREL